MIYVPHHLLLSVKKTIEHEVLGPILEKYTEVFTLKDKEKNKHICLIIAMRLIYEMI